ncbi:hypothetical protein JTB14_008183 [Gonioctena quinquepunctata]|nr:hypothetical protein JTB14_008183 [Gonioctena quinquepunctata]
METDRVVDETLFGEIIKEEPPEKESISKLNVSYVSYLGSEEDSEESKHSLICADEQEDVIADEDGICGAVDTKTEYEIDIIYEDVKSKIDEKAINSEEHILIERRENVQKLYQALSQKILECSQTV